MTIQSDGKIVLAGTCIVPPVEKGFCAARLNNDGSFDASFDGPGANGTGVGR
ncbi:delta-60 repeat domain-containing protein [Casimicrobium huifangae]|uniref:delta-60 repeat domain-containing protein n=1 Tax=Casimicrobium huifangae TaxID=2591109 RepID=UPI00378488E5